MSFRRQVLQLPHQYVIKIVSDPNLSTAKGLEEVGEKRQVSIFNLNCICIGEGQAQTMDRRQSNKPRKIICLLSPFSLIRTTIPLPSLPARYSRHPPNQHYSTTWLHALQARFVCLLGKDGQSSRRGRETSQAYQGVFSAGVERSFRPSDDRQIEGDPNTRRIDKSFQLAVRCQSS